MIPACHNREPFMDPNAGWRNTGFFRVRYAGLYYYEWKPVYRYRWPWFDSRCATWQGVGIGEPTAEYPTGTPYPIAKGWSCAGCRWMPA